MNTIVIIFAVILLIIGIATWIIYKYIPKLLWCVPTVALLISGSLLLRDIFLIKSEPTFAGKLNLYFHNDWSMSFYLFYIPIIVVSIVATVIAYLIKHSKK
jgi:hypothetical protein